MGKPVASDVFQKLNVDETVDVLRRLVRIPSRNPPGQEKPCAEFVTMKLQEWGFEVQVIPEPFPDRPQVVARYRGSEGHPTLILNGHMDVVPEGEVERWSFNPYGGIVKDGKLFGRGSSDMKGGITSMLMAAKIIKDSGVNLRGDLVLQFVVGEETGDPGTKHLLSQNGFKGDFGIVLEPTNLQVATALKGVAWFKAEIEGKPSHAGMPERGINAIHEAARVIRSLENYNQTLHARLHPLLGRETCSVTMIGGGTKENVIPESCAFTIDRRFLPNQSVEIVEEDLKALLAQQGVKYELSRGMVYEPAEVPPDSTIAQALQTSMRQVTGIEPKVIGMPCSTDARNFVNDARISAVSWGPGDISLAHSTDEFIELDQLITSIKVLTLTAMQVLA